MFALELELAESVRVFYICNELNKAAVEFHNLLYVIFISNQILIELFGKGTNNQAKLNARKLTIETLLSRVRSLPADQVCQLDRTYVMDGLNRMRVSTNAILFLKHILTLWDRLKNCFRANVFHVPVHVGVFPNEMAGYLAESWCPQHLIQHAFP